MSVAPFRNRLSPFDDYIRSFCNLTTDEWERVMPVYPPFWYNRAAMEPFFPESEIDKLYSDTDKFEIEMNVSQFAPDELSVNVIDNDLVVEGHHNEKNDEHGKIERHFIRKFRIPHNVPVDEIKSKLNKGVLSVCGPKKNVKSGRNIPISATTSPRASPTKSKKK